MPAPVQDIVPSFTYIPGPSRKIEAPSPSEINFSPYDWGKTEQVFGVKKNVVVNMRKMLFKPIKHKSWHVTVALMSLHVASLSV